MRALQLGQDATLHVSSCDEPVIPPGWSMIAPHSVGICGSDIHLVAGGFSERVTLPLTLGHEMAGEVVESPDDTWAPGSPVFVSPLLPCSTCSACRGGFPNVCSSLGLLGIDRDGAMAGLVAVPTENLYALPQTVDLGHASLIEPLSVAVHMTGRIGLTSSDDALIVGGGPIGALLAIVMRLHGVESIRVVEMSPGRRAILEKMGFDVHHPDERPALQNSASVVCDASGVAAGLDLALDSARSGARVLLSGFGYQSAGIDLGLSVVKELTLVGSRVYTDADIRQAIKLFNSPQFPVTDIVSAKVTMADLAQQGLVGVTGADGVMKVIVNPGEEQ